MAKTTTEITIEYIKNHPYIKSCLKKGLINYSSLARLISKEEKIEKKTSKDAILIASRRFKETLSGEEKHEKLIKDLLSKSEIDIKNKVLVLIIDKHTDIGRIDDIQKTVRKDYGIFYLLEGTDNYTIITQERYLGLFTSISVHIFKVNKNLASIVIKSPRDIENVIGVVSYLTGLFSENNVNILEFLSCWTDTVFVIDSKDVQKAISFLKF